MILLIALSGTVFLISVSIMVFLIIMIVMVAALLYAKKKLTPGGLVNIDINNGEKVLEIEPGSNILSSLSNNSVYLPSACGGGGTCGMCRCQVIEGGGEILPTEVGFFSRKEQQHNWRLGCQVKVRNDIKIRIPEAVLGIRKWECEVVSNHNVSTFIREFKVKLPEGERLAFLPGSYIQIDVPEISVDFSDFSIGDEYRAEWDKLRMWDLKMKNTEPTYRAYSMANHPAEGNMIMLNIRIATPPWDPATRGFARVNPGVCSSYIYSLKPGDKVMISGPYGEFHIKPTQREMVYIGGGAGMAPLRSHIFHLFNTEKTGRKVSYWYGARSKQEIFYEDEFRQIEKNFPNFTFNLALSEPKPDDHWTGYTGFIHQVLFDQYLSKIDEPEEIEYYLCGPPAMNAAVLKLLANLGVPDEMIAFDDFGG